MPVIAALDRERQFDAERRKHVGRPRAERDHHIARIDRPGRGLDAPIRVARCSVRASPVKREAAERGEARGIGARQRQRIVDTHRAAPMNGMAEFAAQRRFERQRAVAVERYVGDAKARRQFEFRRLRGERACRCDKA